MMMMMMMMMIVVAMILLVNKMYAIVKPGSLRLCHCARMGVSCDAAMHPKMAGACLSKNVVRPNMSVLICVSGLIFCTIAVQMFGHNLPVPL